MNGRSLFLILTTITIAILVFRPARALEQNPIYSPTFPTSGVVTNGTSTSTYTTGESVTDFGGVYFLGERKSCAKIGNGFICN